jgi:acyl carrier protein
MTESPQPHSLAEIGSWLRERVAFYLDQPEESIEPDVPLTDYGMNSIYAVSVLADIEDEFGVEFESVPTWSHPSINQMAKYLENMLAELVSAG